MIFLPVLAPLIFAIVAIALQGKLRAQKWIAIIGGFVTTVVAVDLLMEVQLKGSISYNMGSWEAPYGINFVADRLSVLMVAVSSFIGLCTSIYAMGEIKADFYKKNFSALFLFLLAGVNGAYLTGDLFNLYVWFEVLLTSSFMLLVLGMSKDQLKGSLKYVTLNLIGSTLFLIGAGMLYGKLGTLNLADIAQKIRVIEDAELIYTSGVMLVLAFGIKAGVFPLFFWLPSSYPTTPSTISSLFAGLLTKVGIYALLRTTTLFLAPNYDDFKTILITIAIATMVVGVLGALANHKIKQILSFHIISQVGYILAGIALMTVNGLAGAIFYLLHHIIVKSNLFLIAGVIHKKFGSDEIKQHGGLYSLMPLLSLLFFISAFSLAGLPPLSGFWAKLGVLQSSVVDGQLFLTLSVVIVGIVTLMSMLKIWMGSFWKPASSTQKIKPVGVHMLFSCVLLGMASLVIGLYAPPFYEYAEKTATELLEPQHYINTVLGLER